MSFTVQLGASAWDAVAYVRNLIEDTAGAVIPDGAFKAYAEDVNEDFSRHIPLDYLVGNPYLATSALATVAGQQNYVCSSANGFTATPMWITDVLYSAGSGYSAASEIAYLALLPFSPINRFLFTPSLLDSPSERILRDQYLNELSHYGTGYYSEATDPTTGLPSINLFPIPASSGTPIYVRYAAQHLISVTDPNNWKIVTIPEHLKRNWAQLLAAQILEEEGDRIAKTRTAKAGLIEIQADSRTMEAKIDRLRLDAYGALGGHTSVGLATQ